MILLQLYWAFFKVGALGFGGGLAIIQLIYETIQPFTSMTQAEFANIVAIAQVTPGPVAINTATYVGYETAGLVGAAVATIGVATPAFIIISIAARMLSKYKESKVVLGALGGVRPATLAMMATAIITVGVPAFVTENPLAGINIGKEISLLGTTGTIDIIAVLITIATVVLIGKFKISSIKTLMKMAAVGAAIGFFAA